MRDRKHTLEEIIDSFYNLRRVMSTPGAGLFSGNKLTFSQWALIRVVETHPGITITELANALGISCSGATQQVDVLVKKGHLARQGSREDRRFLSVRLSPGMQKQIGPLHLGFVEKMHVYFNTLSDDELHQYLNLNQKIVNNIARNFAGHEKK